MWTNQEDEERLTEGGYWAMDCLSKAYRDLPEEQTPKTLQDLLHQLSQKKRSEDG